MKSKTIVLYKKYDANKVCDVQLYLYQSTYFSFNLTIAPFGEFAYVLKIGFWTVGFEKTTYPF